MSKVNLDALIAREDFEVEENSTLGTKKDSISIEDLKKDAFFFANVRKPDFQRETNEWDAAKITQFILSFLDGDLIPAIILWQSHGGTIFAIDGSHRLSSLSAWINDDYGDGKISKLFYDGVIPDKQLQIARLIRNAINKKIGSYEDFQLAPLHPDKVKPEVAKRAKRLGSLAIKLQWVDGDASSAENSFFKINQQAAPINKTELKLLRSRKKPNSIAARAIIRSGKGHKYWSCFENEKQEQIQELAFEINKRLFDPELETPIKTLDIPIGGKTYSAQTLPLILDFVNVANKLDQNGVNALEDDVSGDETIIFLKKAQRIAWMINSNHPSSLGLHPLVYFYSNEARHKVANFFAIVDLMISLREGKRINVFVTSRKEFESFIQKYDYLVQQINRKHRSVQASYKHISSFFEKIILLIDEGKSADESVADVIKTPAYDYLNIMTEKEVTVTQKDFSTGKKSAAYVREALKGAPKCKICHGLVHKNSISIDHIQRKQDGGVASLDNAQLTHPYCNTGFKN